MREMFLEYYKAHFKLKINIKFLSRRKRSQHMLMNIVHVTKHVYRDPSSFSTIPSLEKKKKDVTLSNHVQ
jgi:hypothetical protein